MTPALLRRILESAAAALPFDRDFYLEQNRDVREGVRQRKIFYLHEHYVEHGHFEDRHAAPADIDEAW
ncbi:MAG TPA: hypothetical protein VM755_09835 [Stellaceae bacterium]|nr:hypothetical protein [Stellaceae bacterium]